MKKCPFCAEEIQDEAIKCRYCGSMLDGTSRVPQRTVEVDTFQAEAMRLVREKGVIHAIKFVKEQRGFGLVEAKAYVEGLGVTRDPSGPMQAPRPNSSGCVALTIVALAVAIGTAIFSGLFSSSSNAGTRETTLDASNMAFIQCQEFVKRRLKAPATADFPFLDRQTSLVGVNEYLVQSYVDAQNAFGATIRSNWTCRIRLNGGQDADIRNWSLVDLSISER